MAPLRVFLEQCLLLIYVSDLLAVINCKASLAEKRSYERHVLTLPMATEWDTNVKVG